LQYADVAARLSRFRSDFQSLWVMAHHILGTIFSTRELGAIPPGWAFIGEAAEALERDEPEVRS
jgi:hypothetical protein